MKLLEIYSLATGLKVGDQHLEEAFYPLPFDRYITIQGGSGMAAKNYPHYAEVVELMRPALDAAGIRVVQLGGQEDQAIPGCYGLQGKTDLHQSSHILRHSLCHVGNDSWLAHRAGAQNVPLVVSYGPTSPHCHAPFRSHPKSVFIESHRFGRRPTYASQESPATIAVIPPEQIANAALGILDLKPVTRQSILFGEAYNQSMLQLVPDSVVPPSVTVHGPLIVRMDLVDATADWAKAENFLAANLQIRQCAILTNREINPNLLAQFKPHVAGLRIEVDKVSADWIKVVKRLGIQVAYYSSEQDPAKLARLRLDLYDACLFDQFTPPTKDDAKKLAAVYANKDVDMDSIMSKMQFKTRKLLLSEGKVFLSEAHWRAGQPTPNAAHTTGQVIDSPKFWEEAAHYYLFIHE